MYFIQQTLMEKLLSEIGNRPYTILIDETTDESNIIQMDVHIRWAEEDKKKSKT